MKELTLPFKYNRIDTLETLFEENKGEIAAVIMEPTAMTAPDEGFLEAVKEVTHKNNAVLIYDEMFTGFRFALGGAQEYFNVTPDLACFGKALSNGMPLSALVGKSAIMKELEEAFYSVTFAGEAVSLAASVATIDELQKKNVINYIWEKGEVMKKSVSELITQHGLEECMESRGFAPKNFVAFKDANGITPLEMKTLFQQECIKRGILFIGYHCMSFAHQDKDIETTLEAYDDSMGILKKAVESGNINQYLEAPLLVQIFKSVGDRWGNIEKDGD